MTLISLIRLCRPHVAAGKVGYGALRVVAVLLAGMAALAGTVDRIGARVIDPPIATLVKNLDQPLQSPDIRIVLSKTSRTG